MTPAAPAGPDLKSVTDLLAAVADHHDASHSGPFRWCYATVCRAAGRLNLSA